MKFRSSLFAAALAASSLAAGTAGAAQVRRATADGMQFEYTSIVDKGGTLHLAGKEARTGERFLFKVRADGSARGFVENQPVSFRVPRDLAERALRYADK